MYLLVTVANRPDTAMGNKQDKPCLLIDVATPNDSIFSTKETEKLTSTKSWRSRPAGCGKWGQNWCQLQWERSVLAFGTQVV
jgi:hypothetical protein